MRVVCHVSVHPKALPELVPCAVCWRTEHCVSLLAGPEAQLLVPGVVPRARPRGAAGAALLGVVAEEEARVLSQPQH